MKIINAVVANKGWEGSTVTVTYVDNSEEVIINFYSDELYFSSQEFIGLTRKEAKELWMKKDKAYLQS